jgi:hypothetical protein
MGQPSDLGCLLWACQQGLAVCSVAFHARAVKRGDLGIVRFVVEQAQLYSADGWEV